MAAAKVVLKAVCSGVLMAVLTAVYSVGNWAARLAALKAVPRVDTLAVAKEQLSVEQ